MNTVRRNGRGADGVLESIFVGVMLLIAAASLTAEPTGAPDAHSGSGNGGLTRFVVEHSQNQAGEAVGDLGGRNRGLGQRISLDAAYTPETFSVSIRTVANGPFKNNSGSGNPVDVTLDLRIWDDTTGVLYGWASSPVAAGATGEVTFVVQDAVTIPPGAVVRYAVFVGDAAGSVPANRIRGYLQVTNSQYNGHDAVQTRSNPATTNQSGANPVDSFESWTSFANRSLVFSLTGTAVDPPELTGGTRR